MVKLKPKEQKSEYEGKIDKMKLPFMATWLTLSTIKDFTLLCVIKWKFLRFALEFQAPTESRMSALRNKISDQILFMPQQNSRSQQ